MSGLHVALLVAAVISLLGALLAPMIRRGHAESDTETRESPPASAEPPAVVEPAPATIAAHNNFQDDQRIVRGLVRQADGSPVAAAAITLIDPDGRQTARQLTDRHGGYRLAAPGAGHYVLIARAASYQPQAIEVELNGRPLSVELTLTGSAGVAGLVSTPNGAPIALATVTLADSRGNVIATRSTDETGRYAIDELVAGDYTLVASASRLPPLAVLVNVPRPAGSPTTSSCRAGRRCGAQPARRVARCQMPWCRWSIRPAMSSRSPAVTTAAATPSTTCRRPVHGGRHELSADQHGGARRLRRSTAARHRARLSGAR